MKTLLLTSVLLFAGLASAAAQNRLVAADSVAQLRRVWIKQGVDLTADRYGRAVWGGVDLTGDSIGDFAVYRESTNEWYFYAGGPSPDTAAFWVMDSVGRAAPIIGDFYGDGSLNAIFTQGEARKIDGVTYFYVIPTLYDISDTGIVSDPVDTNEMRAYLRSFALELNGKPGLELVVLQKFSGGDQPGYIEIYEGGPDFQIRRPTVVIIDTGFGRAVEFNWDVRFADFDGDGRLDLLAGGGYEGAGEMLRFYWGDENSPQSWSERDFDRSIVLEHGVHGINNMATLHVFDANGDGAADLGSYEFGAVQGNRLYLSAQGKNMRTRSLALDDADVFYRNGFLLTISAGFLNDTTRRYEPIFLADSYAQPDPGGMFMVSGGSWGPDHDYDAEYSWANDGFGRNGPIGYESRGVRDITGDGWDDFIGASGTYGSIVSEGIVMIFAGGPYIPFDDPTVGLREEPMAGNSRGLFLWPNPVVDRLHIAWRGDLGRMPARFEVFDLQGRRVVVQEVEWAGGTIVWECGGVAAGMYTLVGYDATGRQIAAVPVLIQR